MSLKNLKLKIRIYQMFLNRPCDIVDEIDFCRQLRALSLTKSNDYVVKLLKELTYENKIKKFTDRHNIKYVLSTKDNEY